MKTPNKHYGFSLLELLFVFTILGILSSFLYPSYQHYLTKARRSDGQVALLDLASRMEQYYSQENTYETATIGTGSLSDIASNISLQGWYTLNINSATDRDFSLTATPRKFQDTLCQALTLTSTGLKGIAPGPSGTPTGTIKECW